MPVAIATIARVSPMSWSRVSLSLFPSTQREELWRWLNQFRAANFDDASPQTFEQFDRFFPQLMSNGRELLGIEIDDRLLGAVGFEPLSPGLAMLRGIVFDQSAHGSGAPRAAIAMFFVHLWRLGYRKISAQVLASNPRACAFLRKLGAIEEGYLRAHAIQEGRAVDMRLLAVFRPGGE